MKKLSLEKMKEHIKSGKYYITYCVDWDEYYLSQTYADGRFKSEIKITKERAQEWLDAGAELDRM